VVYIIEETQFFIDAYVHSADKTKSVELWSLYIPVTLNLE